MELSEQLHAPVALPRGTHCTGVWADSGIDRSELRWEEKYRLALPGMKPISLGRPVRSPIAVQNEVSWVSYIVLFNFLSYVCISGNNSKQTFMWLAAEIEHFVACRAVSRQRLGKDIPAVTDTLQQ
jgi:hypothetical protein